MVALGRPRLTRPGRPWLIALAVPWLVCVLLMASPAGAAHPHVSLGIRPAAADSPDLGLVESPPPATPGTAALICLVVLAFAGSLATRQWRRPATLATLGLLAWFLAEAAFHSAHHVTDPGGAEHCPVFPAAQHLPGVDPEPDVPAVGRPVSTTAAPLPPVVLAGSVDLEDDRARAPPVRPA